MSLEEKIARAKVLIFDLDGTLVDTDYANFLAYKKAIEQSGLALEVEYSFGTRFTRRTLKEIFPNIKEEQENIIIQAKNRCYVEYLPKTKLMNECSDILKEYHKTKITVLSTSSSKERALITLAHHGLLDLFRYRFYKQDVSEIKTNKFERILTFLKAAQDDVIVFENEEAEIKAARLAKVPPGNIINLAIAGSKHG